MDFESIKSGLNNVYEAVKEKASQAVDAVSEEVSQTAAKIGEKASEIAQDVQNISVFNDNNYSEASISAKTSVFENQYEDIVLTGDEVSFSFQPQEQSQEESISNSIQTQSLNSTENNTIQQENSVDIHKIEENNSQSRNPQRKKEADVDKLADEFYKLADDYAGFQSVEMMQNLMDKQVNSDNIIEFLNSYEKTRQDDSSIIDTIINETGAKPSERKKALNTIWINLEERARKAGVSEEEIKKARNDFNKSMNEEVGYLLHKPNAKDMENSLDFLRGSIAAKTMNDGEISDVDAIKQFYHDVSNQHADAQKDFQDARNNEEWIAKLGDSAFGIFGCTTIEDMEKQLGASAKDIEKLSKSKTVGEFKQNYKEIFGVEFDKNKIIARQNAIEKYQEAQSYNAAIELSDNIIQNAKSYDELRAEIKNQFPFNDNEITEIINHYGNGKNMTDDAKKEALIKYLNDIKTNASNSLKEISGGKTIEQMEKDIDVLTQSALGTKNIAKDVAQFNHNQELTGMIAEAGVEIAATVALQAVPGLGQAAAARLAVNAAKWGSKAAKAASYAKDAEKGFNAIKKFQEGKAFKTEFLNKEAKIGSQMATAGLGTLAVDLSNGKTIEEATKKALMNMGFAGVGVSANMISPKLAQTFGFTSEEAAVVAEQLINLGGSAAVVAASGGEYGKEDAAIDFATGLVMSKLMSRWSGKHSDNKAISDSGNISNSYLKNSGKSVTQLMPNFPHTNGSNATVMPGISTNYQKFEKGQVYHITPDEFKDGQLILAGGMNAIDLNDKFFWQKFNALKDGESFTVGSWEGNADYKIGSKNLGVSREHLTVMKDHGRMLIRDNSKNGTSIRQNWQSSISPQEVSALFPNNQIPFNHTISEFYKQKYKIDFTQALDATDYQNMAKLMNVCNGKYIHAWKGTCWSDNISNISKLAVLEKILRKNDAIDDFLKLGPHEWDLVVNSTCQKDPLTMDALLAYKNGSGTINGMLTAQKNGKNWNNPFVQEQIDKLTKFLDTQTVNKKIRLYRSEGYDVMDNIKTKNGQSLGQVMRNLAYGGASEKDILKFIDEELLSVDIKQERFMSTALTKEFPFSLYQNNIFWELSAPAGTKAAFCEDFDLAYKYKENEVLVQRGSVLSITGARFDKNLKKWIISATIKQK